MSFLDDLKTFIITKVAGRVLVLALAALAGWMLKANLPADLVTNWIDATTALAQTAIPIIVAAAISYARHQAALYSTPPKR